MSETGPRLPGSRAGLLVRRGLLIAVYLVAAAGGYRLGARGLLRVTNEPRNATADAAARVGVALGEEAPRADAVSWAALRDDIDVTRAAFPPPQRQVLDLVVAVRGIENGGQPEWTRAAEQCRALGWGRCERATLEELRKLTRP